MTKTKAAYPSAFEIPRSSSRLAESEATEDEGEGEATETAKTANDKSKSQN